MKANIVPDDLRDISVKSQFAQNQHEMALLKEKAQPSLSPAYTEKFRAGTWKGKSPAEVILEGLEKDGQTLDTQYDFLEKNANKYRANRDIMNAIREAQALHKAGKLRGGVGTKVIPYVLHKVPLKILESTKRKDGRCFTYSMEITWNIGAKTSPIEVHIVNMYCFALKSDTGGTKADMSDDSKRELLDYKYTIEVEEWNRMLSKMNNVLNAFYNAAYPHCKKQAQQIRMQKAKAAKAAKQDAENG